MDYNKQRKELELKKKRLLYWENYGIVPKNSYLLDNLEVEDEL